MTLTKIPGGSAAARHGAARDHGSLRLSSATSPTWCTGTCCSIFVLPGSGRGEIGAPELHLTAVRRSLGKGRTYPHRLLPVRFHATIRSYPGGGQMSTPVSYTHLTLPTI